MSEFKNVPIGEIRRSPETTEEKWSETVRLAASLIDNDGVQLPNKHPNALSTPYFYEFYWTDPDTDEKILLQRWCTKSYGPDGLEPQFKYILKVYGGMNRSFSDVADREYRFSGKEKGLEIRDGKTYLSISVFCARIRDDESGYYDDLYEYFSRSQQVAQLTARRSAYSNRPVNDDDAFENLVLEYAIDNQSDSLSGATQLEHDEYLERIHKVTGAILESPMTTSREGSDVHSSKWRLERTAVIGGVMRAAGRFADVSIENEEFGCKNESAE